MKHNNKKGFTIVELVIVIAVIAILAAVLIPTFAGVTQGAKHSAAQSEAKSALTVLLALNNGSMAEGTIFAINDDDDTAAEFGFAYSGSALRTIKDSAFNTIHATVNDGFFNVYVALDALNEEKNAFAAGDGDFAQAAIQKYCNTADAESYTWAATAGADYITYTGTKEGADSYVVHIYYTNDIKPSTVVFVGDGTALSTEILD